MTLTLIGIGQVAAQSYFDGKVIKEPVPHKVHYSQEEFTLKKVIRTAASTILVVDFYNPWQDKGWSKRFLYSDCLIDRATGDKYPLIYADGIPKEPFRYVFPTEGEQRATATLYFAPMPDSVKKVDASMGYSDIDLSGLPIVNPDNSIKQWFPKNLKSDKIKYEIIAVTDDGKICNIWFKYTAPDDYKSHELTATTTPYLLDPKTGNKYKLLWGAGLPQHPKTINISRNESIGYVYQFESPLKDGVKLVDFIANPAGSVWNISGITLD